VFAIFLNKNMDPFYQNISSFPTAIFSVLLIICMFYWIGAVLGLIDIDILNVDTDLDLNADSGHAPPDVLAGLLIKFKLVGVPVVITLSLIFLFGWLICYFLAHYLLGNVENWILRLVLGIPLFAISLVAAAWITSFAMKPLRGVFKRGAGTAHKHILGQRAVVRTSRVDENFGEATLDDGGAGLILKIRSSSKDTFTKGDRVVVFERLNNDNIYRVISEEEFNRPA